jgi:peptidoglycan hydrolase-like protein with peptidoglycan-binding domain
MTHKKIVVAILALMGIAAIAAGLWRIFDDSAKVEEISTLQGGEEENTGRDEPLESQEEADGARLIEQIRNVQIRLRVLGYDIGNLDGHLGDQTRDAIRAFQEASGLPVSGEISEDWLATLEREVLAAVQVRLRILGYDVAAINGLMDESTAAAVKAFQKRMQLSVMDTLNERLLVELNRKTLRELQIRLNMLGYDIGRLDGRMGPRTEAAISAFQESVSVPVTGKVAEDWVLLLNRKILQNVEKRLRDMGYEVGSIDGRLDETTQAAIKAFQKAEKITVTGEISEQLLARLRHQSLRDIQARLRILGYDIGPVDGYMGGRTITAIRDYQDASGLPVTGKVSEDWVKRLDRDALRNIQMRLRFLGFEIDAIDGHMGVMAREAIRAFQEAEELPVTT